MSKPRIIVARTGSPFRPEGKGLSANAEFDTMGIINALADSGQYDIAYLGHTIGGEYLRDDVELFVPDLTDVDAEISGAELEERWSPMVEAAREFDACCCVNVSGATPTWSWPDNPTFASTRDFCVRYNAPGLYAMHKLDLKRILIVTDPKVYVRDSEMATIWPNIRPIAVLSQEDDIFPKRIQGKSFKIRAVYAGCEYWATYGMQRLEAPDTLKKYTVTLAANTHIGEPRLKGDRAETWDDILLPWLQSGEADNTRICGKGWDKHALWVEYPDVFLGVLKDFKDVMKHLGSGIAGPCIPQKKGFNTTKVRLHALAKNVPLFFGRFNTNHIHTYDARERVLPLNHPCRIDPTCENDMARAIQYANANYLTLIEEVLAKTEPNLSLLHECIHELDAGINPDTLSWVQKFGGYVKCY